MNQNGYVNIVQQAWEKRKLFIEREALEVYRLYDRDDPSFTKAVIDVFRDWVVIRLYEDMSSEAMDDLTHAVASVMLPKGIYLNDRRKDCDLAKCNIFLWGEKHPDVFIVSEYRHKFLVDLTTRLDHGLFLDLRLLRRWVEDNTRGKTILNLFGYTGSFVVYAARGGSASSVSVDISSTYNTWAESNYKLNLVDLDLHKLYSMEVMDFLKYAQKKAMKFDLIIADPPTFSRAKRSDFSLQNHYPALLHECREVLGDNGLVIFSHHQRDFVLDKNKIPFTHVQDVSKQFLPADFCDVKAHQCYLLKT
jgi:23S rRNA G2069 N7-methylase RlmK/C1962 C5-methylase RlmI